MANLLDSLKIDYWYKAVLVISTGVLVVSLTVPMQAAPNGVIATISLGGLFIGLGEWINHPLRVGVGYGYQISGHPRSNSFLGVMFVLLGLALVGYGVYKLVQ